MGDVLKFKDNRKFHISVCDGNQNYQTFEAERVEKPTLSFEEHQVWWRDEKVHVTGAHSWGPAIIKGPKEIAEAIKFGETPIRVTFEHKPRKAAWWELHECYLSTESTDDNHIIRFKTAIRHEYD